MTVGVIDGLEMVDVDQCNDGLLMTLAALAKLQLQQVLPGTVVEQPGQTVGAAQGAQRTFVLRQLDRQPVADHAQRQRVERQHR
ncbi:hypothetical protein D9M73_180010 [compost metagenome]